MGRVREAALRGGELDESELLVQGCGRGRVNSPAPSVDASSTATGGAWNTGGDSPRGRLSIPSPDGKRSPTHESFDSGGSPIP